MTATWGRPIYQARQQKPAALGLISPERAIGETLGEYLRCAVFSVKGTDGVRNFSLKGIDFRWPEAGKDLEYPRASIVERTDMFHEASLTPRPLEDTLGMFDERIGYACDPLWPKTVLWKTAELSGELQVDVWLSSDAERDAVRAQLGYLFNPADERGGVLLGGHPLYFSRAVRVTLLSSRAPDEPDAVYANERRLQVNVSVEIDVVDLRLAVLLTPTATVDAIDPNTGASS